MTENRFKALLQYNEPCFGYNGKDYMVSHPQNEYCVWSEDSPGDTNLTFSTVDELLDGWRICGRTLREILPEIDLKDMENNSF